MTTLVCPWHHLEMRRGTRQIRAVPLVAGWDGFKYFKPAVREE